MKTTLETKTSTIGAIPSGSTVVLFAAVVDGVPTAAQIDAARNTFGASLELVGATATTAYLMQFEPVEVGDGEKLVATATTSLAKISPELEPVDEELLGA
jgi:hypothetical protein